MILKKKFLLISILSNNALNEEIELLVNSTEQVRERPKNYPEQKKYCRLKSAMRTTRRHSNFWVGLYGALWIQTYEFCHDLVEPLMIFTPNKVPKQN